MFVGVSRIFQNAFYTWPNCLQTFFRLYLGQCPFHFDVGASTLELEIFRLNKHFKGRTTGELNHSIWQLLPTSNSIEIVWSAHRTIVLKKIHFDC